MTTLKEHLESQRVKHLLNALETCQWDRHKAANLLGISQATTYRIIPRVTRRRASLVPSTRRAAPRAKLRELLHFFGVLQPCEQEEALNGNIEYLFLEAKERYLKAIKSIHPDLRWGDSEKMLQVNAAWSRLKRLFRKRGVAC